MRLLNFPNGKVMYRLHYPSYILGKRSWISHRYKLFVAAAMGSCLLLEWFEKQFLDDWSWAADQNNAFRW